MYNISITQVLGWRLVESIIGYMRRIGYLSYSKKTHEEIPLTTNYTEHIVGDTCGVTNKMIGHIKQELLIWSGYAWS